MMFAVAAVLAVVAVVLLVMLISTRGAAATAQAAADKRQAELSAEIDELKQATKDQAAELTETKQTVADLEGAVSREQEAVKQLRKDLKGAKAQVAEQAAQIEKQLGQVADLLTERTTLQGRLAESEAARAAAVARNVGLVIDETLAGDDARAKALWELELLRSERTWRTSVAVDPATPHSPFDDADDLVRLAVEVEAAALRENVGNAVDIDWDVPQLSDPARSHLVVRVAQEMLESAARCNDPTKLSVSIHRSDTADDDTAEDADDENERTPAVRLQLHSLEEPAEEDLLNFIPPRITSELVDLTEDGVVTVTSTPPASARSDEGAPAEGRPVIDLTDGVVGSTSADDSAGDSDKAADPTAAASDETETNANGEAGEAASQNDLVVKP